MLLCMRIAACSPDLAQLVEQLLQATPTLGKILLANSLGVYFNAIAQRLCIGMFLAPSTSNDLVRNGICSIFGFANSIPPLNETQEVVRLYSPVYYTFIT